MGRYVPRLPCESLTAAQEGFGLGLAIPTLVTRELLQWTLALGIPQDGRQEGGEGRPLGHFVPESPKNGISELCQS